MLSIKNIVKTYKPKKGVPVKALDDVSLDFKETGLVFILGKSGSGKSTLLNAIGGLDKVDSGEFIIKGKSSKEFTAGDFDAYRNTFIGFIFQEYNILTEFTVGQNIALAMELQGKKATSEALNKILDEVDLTGYANRKPNELSGGQKQRVAIARALIKEPEIIMADEPTGALDSNTGKQVFDTLKKLSETKLVIVVSHDREFAEYYGDRVIELADGKIISDISKYESDPETKSEGIKIIDNRILQIKGGYTLTNKDMDIINEYLKGRSEDTIISSDKRTNDNLKKIAMISEDGSKASFKDTSEEDTVTKEYDKSKTKFIKSRLPYRNALKIGASSLKVKPLRLFFTILLSFIAFAMFGLTDTLAAYNERGTATQSILDSSISYVTYVVQKNTENQGYYSDVRTGDATLTELKEQSGVDLYPVISGESQYSQVSLPTLSYPQNNYYKNTIAGIAEIGLDPLVKMGANVVAGRMPNNINEIAITNYHFSVLQKYGLPYIAEDGSVANVKAAELTLDDASETGILNKKIEIRLEKSVYLTIVGVVETNLDQKYDSLKESGTDGFIDYAKYREFEDTIAYGIHGMVFAYDGFIDNLYADSETAGLRYNVGIYSNDDMSMAYTDVAFKLSHVNKDEITWINGEKQTLADNELIISSQSFMNMLYYFSSDTIVENVTLYDISQNNGDTTAFVPRSENVGLYQIGQMLEKHIAEYIIEKGVPQDYINTNNLAGYTKAEREAHYYYHLSYNFYSEYVNIPERKEIKERQYKFVIDVIKNMNLFDFDDNYIIKHDSYTGAKTQTKIVGVWDNLTSNVIISDKFYDSSKEEGNYAMYIGVMPDNAEGVRKLVDLTYDFELSDNGRVVMKNAVVTTLSSINNMIEMFSKIFLYVGIAMAAFSAMLLSNFIAVSIANKKREIGILRAVGAKSSDVFSIFFNESFIIAMINFALALAAAIAAVIVLNNTFSSQLGLSITLLIFGIRQIALMFVLSIAVALIASFLPVYSIAKKQPIDSIQGR